MRPSIFDDFWMNRSYERFIATDELIRENQRKNRLQREREERAAQENNSATTDTQKTPDKDTGQA